ncbi:hypothetical protein TrVE_jg9636 [Triparma verrucosa]|uniref:Uncharacterized protein n=1 Tax=Triparma verrucosa TaxID=1606542 RepID=A0A9W7FJR2_9STRA|nr:hypothetical protein TrVE_jg9636 [Triparma verrucosa]
MESKSSRRQGRAWSTESIAEFEIGNWLMEGGKYGHPGTDGTWFSNWKCHIRTNHPLIGMFFVDKRHPYDRKERVMVFVCTTFIAFSFAVVKMVNISPPTRKEGEEAEEEDDG